MMKVSGLVVCAVLLASVPCMAASPLALPTGGHKICIDGFTFLIPCPGILKGPNLRGGPRPVLFLEEHVVILVALEWRVKVDKVN